MNDQSLIRRAQLSVEGAGQLIGSIIVTPPTPRPAESVRVEVRSPAGAVLEGPGIRVMINGVPGAVRYLQFGGPGQRRLKVLAVSGGVAERLTKSTTATARCARRSPRPTPTRPLTPALLAVALTPSRSRLAPTG